MDFSAWPQEQTPEELVRTLIRNCWRQQEIAREIGVTQPTVSRILSGRHKNPRSAAVERLRGLVMTLHEFGAETP